MELPPGSKSRKARTETRRAMAKRSSVGQVARDHARKTNHRGIGRVAADFVLNLIAYNVIRIPKLMAA
jgi:hypothetical protein